MPTEGDMRKKLEQIKSQVNNSGASEERPTMHKGTLTTFEQNRPKMHQGMLLNEGLEVDSRGKKPVG